MTQIRHHASGRFANNPLSLFLLEKVLYECAYEMNNRPDGIDIPPSGLREVVGNILNPR